MLQLVENGDMYVNDAFGTAHRAHASTAVIAKFFPEDKEFGLLLQGEIDALSKVMSEPQSPLMAVIGGAKVRLEACNFRELSGQGRSPDDWRWNGVYFHPCSRWKCW